MCKVHLRDGVCFIQGKRLGLANQRRIFPDLPEGHEAIKIPIYFYDYSIILRCLPCKISGRKDKVYLTGPLASQEDLDREFPDGLLDGQALIKMKL